jgi:hypothetical protein
MEVLIAARNFARDLARNRAHRIETVSLSDGLYARSYSDNRRVYKVNANGCECKGFFYRGHCKHHAGFVKDMVDKSEFFAR